MPDSEGMLFKDACGCFENAAKFHELRVRGRALHASRHAATRNRFDVVAKGLIRAGQARVITTWS